MLVASIQVQMPSVGTFGPPILPIPSSLGTSFGVFDIRVPPVAGGAVVARDVDGNVVAEERLGQSQSPAPSASPTLSPSSGARSALRNALAAAFTCYSDGATFVGFDPKTARSIEPSLVYNTSSAAVDGEISIREVTRSTILLVTQSSDGVNWCIADDLSVGTGGKTTYDRVDARTIAECTGDVSAWG